MNKFKDLKEKFERVKPRDFYACFQFLIALPISKIYRIYRPNMWLICEESQEARDNGYWLFKHICEKHPEQDIVYAIDKKSPDYCKVEKLGNTVSFGTIKHWIYYLAAVKNISSQKGGKPNAAVCYVLEVSGILKNKRAFLQHGVIVSDMPWCYYKNTKMSLFVCGAEREYEFVRDTYGYPNGIVQYLGLARFDQLHNYEVKKNQILVMPSWREWIGTPTTKSYDLDDMTSFETTEYYKNWSSFLNSEKIADILEQYNLQMIFFPHRNMQKFLSEFKINSERIVLGDWKTYDVQTLLKESAFLVTDYSSIFMDFGYMRKPMAYYQFDYEKFRKGQYGEGYFSYKNDGFGPVFEKQEGLEEYIREMAANSFSNPSEYLEKERSSFPLYDANNCERNYQAIKEM